MVVFWSFGLGFLVTVIILLLIYFLLMMLLVNCVYQLISDYKYLSIFIKSAGLSEYGKPV